MSSARMKTLAFLDFSYLPINLIDHVQITQKLKEQEISFLITTHILMCWVYL